MTQIKFFVTMKVTCEHDEQGYWGDQTKEQVKDTAIQLLQPNFHTIENGVKLKKVEVEFHSDADFKTRNECDLPIDTEIQPTIYEMKLALESDGWDWNVLDMMDDWEIEENYRNLESF